MPTPQTIEIKRSIIYYSAGSWRPDMGEDVTLFVDAKEYEEDEWTTLQDAAESWCENRGHTFYDWGP